MTDEQADRERDVAEQLQSEQFRAKMDEYFKQAFGSVPAGDRLQVPANYDGLKALVDRGVNPTMLVNQMMIGMVEGIDALMLAVPQEQVEPDVTTLVYALRVVVTRFQDEVDTMIRASAMSYAASELSG